MKFKPLAHISILFSIALLFDKTVPFLGLKLDVISLIIGSLFICLALIRKELVVSWRAIMPYVVAVAGILLTTLVGSLISRHIFGTIPISQIKTEYHILLGCFLIFFDSIILGMDDTRFLTYAAYAFLISLVVIITPYIRIDMIQHIIGAKQYRFFGLIGDANYYPTFMMLPIMLIFYFLVKEYYAKQRGLVLAFLYLLFSLTVGLSWWSGSRSGWLGVIAEVVLFIILAARQHTKKKILFIFGWLLVFISAVAVSYILLPHNAKSDIRARLGYITTPEQQIAVDTSSDTLQPIISNGDNSIKTIPLIDAISYSQDRIHIWKQSIHYFVHDPLGYGLVYYNIVNIVSGTDHVTAHSLIFESLLIGGLPLCLILLWLFTNITHGFFTRKNDTMDVETATFAALVGFLICSLFLSALLLRWFWVLMALLIAWQLNRQSTVTENAS
jgi:hypothetical protein